MISLLLLSLLSLFLPSKSSMRAPGRFDVRGLPASSDPWCSANCASLSHCTYLFGSDYVDLQLKTDYSLLDGPGVHLIKSVFLGDTIAASSFKTQLILDLVSSLSTPSAPFSPCRIYVTRVEPGESHHTYQACITRDILNIFVLSHEEFD